MLWCLWLYIPQPVRYLVYRSFVKLFGERSTSAHVTRLPCGLYVKFGDGSDSLLMEALTTQYVRRTTTIPVPFILDFVKSSNPILPPLFVMSEVPGQPLGNMPLSLNHISEAQLARFRETLGDWLRQLRNISRPTHRDNVSNLYGGAFSSYRISFNSSIGPYESIHLFHAQNFCQLSHNANPIVQSLASSLRQKQYCLYLTHGDLSPSNILVDDGYKPIGLVDFQCAAWMPEYWEFTSAVWRRQRYTAWFTLFKDLFPQYAEELMVEMELWETISPW